MSCHIIVRNIIFWMKKKYLVTSILRTIHHTFYIFFYKNKNFPKSFTMNRGTWYWYSLHHILEICLNMGQTIQAETVFSIINKSWTSSWILNLSLENHCDVAQVYFARLVVSAFLQPANVSMSMEEAAKVKKCQNTGVCLNCVKLNVKSIKNF